MEKFILKTAKIRKTRTSEVCHLLMLLEWVNDRQAKNVGEVVGVVGVEGEAVQQGGGSNQAVAERHSFLLAEFNRFVYDLIRDR